MHGRLPEAMAAAGTIHQAAAAVCDNLRRAGLPMPSVYVEVAGRLRCIAQRGYWQVHDGVPPAVGILGATFRSGQPTITPDVRRSADFVAAGQEVVGEVTFPVRHRGVVVGCVNVEVNHALRDADVALVQAAAIAFEGWLARHGGVPPETSWQLLARESAALTELRDQGEIARLAVERAAALTGMTSAVLVLRDPGAVPSLACGGPDTVGPGSDEQATHRVVASHGPLGPALRALEPTTVTAIADWTRRGASVYTFGSFPVTGFSGSDQMWDVGIQALVSVPVMGSGGIAGFLLVADDEQSQPTTEDVQVLELFATHVATALHGADAFAALRDQASRDSLTGLGHGAAFHADLGAAIAAGRQDLAVMLVDLDGFKHVNDTAGHLAGDRVLVEVAAVLADAVGGGTDRVYRIGGDEFAAIVTARTEDEAVAVAERVRVACRNALHTTVSVGVRLPAGLADPAPAPAPAEMLADADLALYDAKNAGRDRVRVYRPALRDVVLAREQLTRELAGAMARDELYLDYQPVLDLGSGAVLGAEALIRWRHPRLGVVAPMTFVPIAEADGQIVAVGAWVVDRAVRQVAAWREATGFPLWVSVNASGTQLGPSFTATVMDALAAAAVPPEALMVEITESALVEESDRVEVLADLRTRGLRIAVDDFGIGWSSLSYLRRLPIDVVKIDRSFVADLQDVRTAAVARAIIGLTETLGLVCIAEGVETAPQVAQLRSLGCHLAQGLLLSRPTDPDGVLAVIADPPGFFIDS